MEFNQKFGATPVELLYGENLELQRQAPMEIMFMWHTKKVV